MTQNTGSSTEMADVYVRLDFIWNTTTLSPRESSTGRYNHVAGCIENGSLEHFLYNVSVEHDSAQITGKLVTTKDQIVEAEITAFEDEIRRAFMKHRDSDPNDPGEADEVHVSAVYLDTPDTPGDARSIRDTHPAVHCALRSSGAPNTLTGTELEETIRSHKQLHEKRIDVRETLSGFNIYIRDSTITRKESRVIRGIITRREDISRPETKLVYTAPKTSALPEPINGADHSVSSEAQAEND